MRSRLLAGLAAAVILAAPGARADSRSFATSVPAAVARSACAQLPPLPEPPPNARSVLDFGATPDDDRDDTAAIQRALDALQPNEWLVFPPGRYLHNNRLRVTVAGTRLAGRGATLHATNPADQAVMLMADGASIYGFTLTAQTVKRGNKPWEARIAIYPRADAAPAPTGNEIRGNRIVADATGGAATANSATTTGVFVYRARGFLVADNTIERTLADGIHITGGASEGRVIGNVVRETGDDMIGVVSYLGRREDSAAQIAADLDHRIASRLVHDIVIEGNELSGQYWGRGIALVGARGITVRANTIRDATMAAAIYVAREPGYATAGVHDAVIEGNRISRVQTTSPRYVASSAPPARRRTGHAAIEVFTQMSDDEARSAALARELGIGGVRIERNEIEDTAGAAVRIRDIGARGAIGGVSLIDNRSARARGKPFEIAAARVACRGNLHEGKPVNDGACDATVAPAAGAALACLRAR